MEQFSIGRVLSRAFALIRGTLGTVGVFILVIVAVQALIGFAMQTVFAGQLAALRSGVENIGAVTNLFESATYWVMLLVTLLGFGLSYAGGLHGLIAQARHGQTSLSDCFRAGLSGMVPVIILTVLWWLAVAVGWVFLVVPALILMSMWAVALPAMIAEGRGIFESFGRSRELTRGHRLSIFGVLVLLLVIYYAAMVVVVGAVLGTSTFSLANLGEATMLGTLLSIPASWASSMLFKSMLTSLYLETALVREGLPTEELVDVFT